MKNITQKKSSDIALAKKQLKSQKRGFTIVELLIALMVSFVVLTAAVTIAYALSSAYESTSDMNEKQAHIRYTNLRLSELIRHSKLVCGASSQELVIWRADDNNDNKINVSEIIYIETGLGNYLRLLQFDPPDPSVCITLPVQISYLKALLIYRYPETYTTLFEQCSGMSITLDRNPPYTQFVNFTFDIEENHHIRTCQISSRLRGRAGNLINAYGGLFTSDDDS